eukprot:m51a1_g515 hypothetical protein (387) ;mRNA; r:323014-324404
MAMNQPAPFPDRLGASPLGPSSLLGTIDDLASAACAQRDSKAAAAPHVMAQPQVLPAFRLAYPALMRPTQDAPRFPGAEAFAGLAPWSEPPAKRQRPLETPPPAHQYAAVVEESAQAAAEMAVLRSQNAFLLKRLAGEEEASRASIAQLTEQLAAALRDAAELRERNEQLKTALRRSPAHSCPLTRPPGDSGAGGSDGAAAAASGETAAREARLEAVCVHAEQRFIASQREIAVLKAKVEDLQKALAVAAAGPEAARSRCAEAAAAVAATTTATTSPRPAGSDEVAALKTANAKVTRKLKDITTRLQVRDLQLKTAEQGLAEAQKAVATLCHEVAELRAEANTAKDLRVKCEKLRDECDALRARFSAPAEYAPAAAVADSSAVARH